MRQAQQDRGFADRAAEALRRDGGRITAARTALFELLATARRPLEPRELHRELRRRGVRIDRVSVYRNVAALLERGLVHRVLGSAAVRACDAEGPSCHHAIVCAACGAAREFHLAAIERALREVREATGYRVLGHLLELQGLCPRCKGP